MGKIRNNKCYDNCVVQCSSGLIEDDIFSALRFDFIKDSRKRAHCRLLFISGIDELPSPIESGIRVVPVGIGCCYTQQKGQRRLARYKSRQERGGMTGSENKSIKCLEYLEYFPARGEVYERWKVFLIVGLFALLHV
jgi:hypothetical protein